MAHIDIGKAKYKGQQLVYLSKDELIIILMSLTKEVNKKSFSNAYCFHENMLLHTKTISIIKLIITMSKKLQEINVNINYDKHKLLKDEKLWRNFNLKFEKKVNNQDYLLLNDITSSFYPNIKMLKEALKIDIIQSSSNQFVFSYNIYMKRINSFLEHISLTKKNIISLNNIYYITVEILELDLQQLNGVYKFIDKKENELFT